MARVPRQRAPDSTMALFADPYGYIPKQAKAHGSDVFEARILLRPTLCMTGPDAARLVYDRSRFSRAGAAPLMLQKTLFGETGVQTLDGAEHLHRKRMLLSIMRPERVAELRDHVIAVWHEEARKWGNEEQIVLYDEVRKILARAVCAWAGMPLREEVVEERTQQLSRLYGGAGKMGLEHWRARRDRDRLERLVAAVIEDVRTGERSAPTDTALAIIAHHRDLDGELLDPHTAAVELLNVLRPTVAVAVYVAHIAHALHTHTHAREKLGDPAYDEAFVQEVRRLYPFFPAIAAKTRAAFTWKGHKIPAGRRVLLDLHGSNRDPRVWEHPETFRPERFLGRPPEPFRPIPQGGGDARTGHRCAGEGATVGIMRLALDMLHHRLRYDVPRQDLTLDTSRPPALPKSRFVIENVTRVDAQPPLATRGGRGTQQRRG